MIDYSKMSDFEINRCVAIYQGFHQEECDIAKLGTALVGVEWNEDTGFATKTLDYCNNPTDAWPIIVANRISIMIDDTYTEWSSASVQDYCDTSAYKHPSMHAKRLRAAMTTYLMMQDEKIG